MSSYLSLYLGSLIFSFIITSIAIIPFINFLYARSDLRPPRGGGLLVILIISLLYAVLLPVFNFFGTKIPSSPVISLHQTIMFFTLITFSIVGQISQLFRFSASYHRFMVAALSVLVATWLNFSLRLDFIYVPLFGVIKLGIFYVPIAALVIFCFSFSTWAADVVDGQLNGLLIICLMAFWAISFAAINIATSLFIALWLGSLIALLYFNVFPSRITTGPAARLGFGATLAVIGLILGKPLALIVIGGLFLANILTSPKKVLQSLGWSTSKIMFRSWLAGIILAIIGVWLALL
jgi:phospho-N-acetylmuramoyl-pentapeptide-transferase